jgi:hypothetical protein
MFCAPGLIFGGAECVGSCFHVLHAWTRFRRYRGRPIPFSCFLLPDIFSVVLRVSGLVFMFSAPGHLFGCLEGVRSRFHILRSRTRFRRYRGHRVPFSCFARPNLFSAEPRSSAPVFMFCVPRLVSRGTESVGSRFHVLIFRTSFRRYRGRRVSFSCFALPNTFLEEQMVSNPFFCVPGLVFVGTDGVESRFYVLRSRSHFPQYRERRFSFSCFARPD